MTWLKESWHVTLAPTSTVATPITVDVFEVLLWQVAMTLASSIEDNKDHLRSFIPQCTPNQVACMLYDTMLQRDTTDSWKNRGSIIAFSYDWEGGTLLIQPKYEATMAPSHSTETGSTIGDIYILDAKQPPSFDRDINMSIWLQSGIRRRVRGQEEDTERE
ncbi:hypothetical protein APHAL10511_003891 [Amanita phalloides]|nr:hypothetical protein APHAL10511_003891 [Amanita phalloides]